jgi:hypothetical protein
MLLKTAISVCVPPLFGETGTFSALQDLCFVDDDLQLLPQHATACCFHVVHLLR